MTPSPPGRVGSAHTLLSRTSRLLPGLILVVLLVQRSQDSADLWWHLARGREVLAGSLFPSRELLTLETLADADWLGGTPFFVAWSIGGVHALSVVPLLAGILIWILGRMSGARAGSRLALIALSPLLLYVIRDDLQAVPRLFDVLGLIFTARLVRSEQPTGRRVVATAALFTAWANLSSGPLWGLLLLLLHCGTGNGTVSMILSAVLGGCLTPRGLMTWRDSFLLMTAGDGPGTNATTIGAATWGLLALWGAWSGYLILNRRQSRRSLIATAPQWLVPIATGLLSPANVPMAGTWILVHLGILSPSAQSTTEQDVARQDVARHRLYQRLSWGTAAALTAVLLFVDCGLTPIAGGRRPGWGIASSIDWRLVDPVWRVSPDETLLTWSPDASCAGMIAWIGENVQLVDHPLRARLGGRWTLHAGVIDDIAGDRRAGYRRADGTWGGWRAQLSDWNVALLGIPAASPLHAILSTTPWQPLDLDAPCIPYVSTDDLRFAPFIVDVIRQQGLVEVGPWHPTREIYDGHGWRTDILDTLGMGMPPRPAILQSQHFRSLGLPMAAARALSPAAGLRFLSPTGREWTAVQHALHHHEETAGGRASEFRRRVLSHIGAGTRSAQETIDAPLPGDDAWETAIELYRQGRLEDALRELPGANPQAAYAAAMILLEMGETAAAREHLLAVVSDGAPDALPILAESWLQEIDPFVESSENQGTP